MKKALAFLLFFTSSVYGQDWISISNKYIRITLDTKTGRYIVSDAENTYAPPRVQMAVLPRHLRPASPAADPQLALSALAGSPPYAMNTAVLNINGSPIFFGSAPGIISPAPKADPEALTLSCNWRIGKVDVTQILRIITNRETLLMDAVSVTYNIRNLTGGTQRIGAKIILDPIPGDGQSVPFRISEGRSVLAETRFTGASVPDYWFSTDRNGELSPYTVRGLLKNTEFIRPDSVLFTSLENAVKARWDHYLNTSLLLTNTDTAVVLSFDPLEIQASEGRTVGTVLGISGIISGQDGGLKANISAFSKQDTNPAVIGLWLTNTSAQAFDEIFLEISAPPVIKVLSAPRQEILNVGSGEGRYVEWILASTTDSSGVYSASVNILGRRNGADAARIPVPFSITWASNTISGEAERIQKALSNSAIQMEAQASAAPAPAPIPELVLAEGFGAGETMGATTESLTKLRDNLKNSSIDNAEDLIRLIDTELQLMKDISQNEKNIAEINQQYTVLRRIYRQLYESSSPVDDRLPANLQDIKDGLDSSEKRLRDQERSLNRILQEQDGALQNSR